MLRFASSILTMALLGAGAAAQAPQSSTLLGVARDGNGHAVADAYITVHSVEHNTDRNVVSYTDGTYSVSDLAAGRYVVNVEREQYTSPQPVNVALGTADQHTLDLTLSAKPLRPRTFMEKLLRIPAHT